MRNYNLEDQKKKISIEACTLILEKFGYSIVSKMNGRVIVVGKFTLTPENERFKHNETGEIFHGLDLLLEKLGLKKHRRIFKK